MPTTIVKPSIPRSQHEHTHHHPSPATTTAPHHAHSHHEHSHEHTHHHPLPTTAMPHHEHSHEHSHEHHQHHHESTAQEPPQEAPTAAATVSMALTPFDDDASCLEEPTFEATRNESHALPLCTNFDVALAGRWVEDADPSKRQSFMTCPLIASQYGCAFMGLRHGLAAQRMRWAPHGCRLRPYCGSTLSSIFRHRRVIFIGDSHARQIFSSFACKLHASGHVSRITGPCDPRQVKPHVSATFPSESVACLAHGQYTNGRVLCGPRRCTGGPTAPRQALQGGPAHGTDVSLRGGGMLMYREPYDCVAPPRTDLGRWGSEFYEHTFANLNAEVSLTPDDVVVVNDIGAARHAHEPHVLTALAASFIRASRNVSSHLIWVDAMAPHFSGAADGEFMHRNKHNQLSREEMGRSCGHHENKPAPRPYRSDLDGSTACRAHVCDAKGASNLPAVGPIVRSGHAVVQSFHATRLAHIAHGGIAFTNYPRGGSQIATMYASRQGRMS